MRCRSRESSSAARPAHGEISTSRRREGRSAGPATVTAPITRDGRSQMAAAHAADPATFSFTAMA